MKLTRFASSSVRGLRKIRVPLTNAQGKYFWAASSGNDFDKWWNITSWWADYNHTQAANFLPTTETDVVILGTVVPYVDLDRQDWVQPQSINAGTTGITFYSALSDTVSCNISAMDPGIVTFTNNSTFNY
jgi:hypothetical protein